MQQNQIERCKDILCRLDIFMLRYPHEEQARQLKAEIHKAFPLLEVGLEYDGLVPVPEVYFDLEAVEQTISRLYQKQSTQLQAFAKVMQGPSIVDAVRVDTPARIKEVIAMDRIESHGEQVSLGSGNAIIDCDAHYFNSPDELHNLMNHLRLLRDDVASLKRLGLLGEGMLIPLADAERCKLSLMQSYVTTNYPKMVKRIEESLWHHQEVDGVKVRASVNWTNVGRLEQAGFVFTNNRDRKVLDLHIEGLVVVL